MKNPIKSKTLWGVLVAAAPQALELAGAGVFGPKVGALVTLGGALLAAYGRVVAREPLVVLPERLPLVALLVALLGAGGCVSRPGAGPLEPGAMTEEFLALARPMAQGFATAMLAHNPRYQAVVCGVADGLGLALQQTELTPEMVDRFTRELRARHPELELGHYALVRGFIVGVYDIWRRRYGPLDPGSEAGARVIGELERVLREACEIVRPPEP